MQLINPKIDYAFKKIFGSEESKDILISFLNALVYDNEAKIKDLEILDPYIAPIIKGVKDTYVDVRARLSDDTTVIIEMQILNYEGFEKRILYNAAKMYSVQLKEGEPYSLLNPVIALTITDFIMFDNIENIKSCFILKEKKELIDYTINDLELMFVELPKFDKSLDNLETLFDKWIFFLKNAIKIHTVPEVFEIVPELKKAISIANRINFTQEELDALQKSEFWIYDQKNFLPSIERRGFEKGLKHGLQKGAEEGIRKGMEQGIQQGMEQGIQRQNEIIIRNALFKGLTIEDIIDLTRLSKEEIQNIINNIE